MSDDHHDVLERKILKPDPGLIKSLGMHHTLESAIADLVDNSIDARASSVLIRFETADGRPTGLAVVDDGCGMNGAQIDEAMRLGRQRDYGSGEQGHFGIGLKAASFSHADTLTVSTMCKRGVYHGRRLRRADVQRDYGCDVLDPASVSDDVDDLLDRLDAESGTVVRWSDTRFPRVTGLTKNDWLEDSRTRLRMHLGVIYHRLLGSRRLRIDIEIFDVGVAEAGSPEAVTAIDPLGFNASGASGYPQVLLAAVGDGTVQLECHILPPKSSGPSFRLYGRDGAEFQGFYIYRSDRLLQVGGWNEVITKDKGRALARVVIDDFPSLSRFVRMNPEKSGIIFSHELEAGIAEAATRPENGDAVSFTDYIARAEGVHTESRRRRRARQPIAEPSRGLHEEIRRVIRAEIPLRKHEDPIEIRWRRMPRDRFLDLDANERVIYLNQQYRQMLTGGKSGLSDAPLLKTLVFLLTEKVFEGHHWGPRDRDRVDMWNAVLGAAVQIEYSYRENGRQP